MIVPSLIYLAITVLLAGVDCIRIKAENGKEANINHGLSVIFAAFAGMASFGFSRMDLIGKGWDGFAQLVPILLGFAAIRLLAYDLSLNCWRIIFKINPTGKIDYVSTVTSSYEDQHSEKVKFWMKRLIAAVGWGMVFIVYHAIFKTW